MLNVTMKAMVHEVVILPGKIVQENLTQMLM